MNNIRTFLATALAVETDTIHPDEATILDVLRRRLTKKERKMLMMELEEAQKSSVMEELALDNERYDEIRDTLYKKLRHPKIRNEITHGSRHGKKSD